MAGCGGLNSAIGPHRPQGRLFSSNLRKPSELTARYRLGRGLQFLGLMILPFAIASELVGQFGLGQSMLVAAGGAALFYVGFVLQNRP